MAVDLELQFERGRNSFRRRQSNKLKLSREIYFSYVNRLNYLELLYKNIVYRDSV